MFRSIQRRLLLAYLITLTSVLGIFAVAVRGIFAQSYRLQLIDELTALAQGAATTAELTGGQFALSGNTSENSLMPEARTLEWFNPERRRVLQAGSAAPDLPLVVGQPPQNQQGRLMVTLPIYNAGKRQIVGYIRASQPLAEFDAHLARLDLGLGSGILLGLVFSGLSSIWFTRQAMQPAEASFLRLKQFTADASHELRSPIMAIQTNAEVALKYPQGLRPEDGERFLAIASASKQMRHLTEDLLLLARTDQTLQPQTDILELSELLANLLSLYAPRAAAKQLTLDAQLSNPVYLRGDGHQLTRLFTNLLTNALNYTPAGGQVMVYLYQRRSHVLVEVRDTGIGIAPEHLERVFDRFWRADKTRSFVAEGSGLGLAIAWAIAQSHGGTITVTSTLGRGSCFAVRLPNWQRPHTRA